MAFKKFFDSEQQEGVTIFDDTFTWFAVTDDNSEDSGVIVVDGKTAVKITKNATKDMLCHTSILSSQANQKRCQGDYYECQLLPNNVFGIRR